MVKAVFLSLIRLYRFAVSPFTGNQCRYHPTCSCYAREAIERHGPLKGAILAVLRVLSCHPFSRRPWMDPVPERFAWSVPIRYKRCDNPGGNHKETPCP